MASKPDWGRTLDVIRKILGLVLLVGVVCSFMYTVCLDINCKVKTKQNAIMHNIEQCQRDYKVNKCDAPKRVRAVEPYCLQKEACINQDPYQVLDD